MGNLRAMSRLIVKNLPNGMKEDRFRQLFAAFGTLTDCSLKFTKEGKFRKFGFIGFKSEEEAQAALNHFHRSFIDTSRITNSASPLETHQSPELGANMPRSQASPSSQHKTPFPQTLKKTRRRKRCPVTWRS